MSVQQLQPDWIWAATSSGPRRFSRYSVPYPMAPLPLEQIPGDDHFLDLGGALIDTEDAGIPVHALDGVVLHVAVNRALHPVTLSLERRTTSIFKITMFQPSLSIGQIYQAEVGGALPHLPELEPNRRVREKD